MNRDTNKIDSEKFWLKMQLNSSYGFGGFIGDNIYDKFININKRRRRMKKILNILDEK